MLLIDQNIVNAAYYLVVWKILSEIPAFNRNNLVHLRKHQVMQRKHRLYRNIFLVLIGTASGDCRLSAPKLET